MEVTDALQNRKLTGPEQRVNRSEVVDLFVIIIFEIWQIAICQSVPEYIEKVSTMKAGRRL